MNTILHWLAGVVARIAAEAGQAVEKGVVLVEFEAVAS